MIPDKKYLGFIIIGIFMGNSLKIHDDAGMQNRLGWEILFFYQNIQLIY